MPGWPPALEILARTEGPVLCWVLLSKCGSLTSKQDVHTINSYSLEHEGIYLQAAHILLTLNAGSLPLCTLPLLSVSTKVGVMQI